MCTYRPHVWGVCFVHCARGKLALFVVLVCVSDVIRTVGLKNVLIANAVNGSTSEHNGSLSQSKL